MNFYWMLLIKKPEVQLNKYTLKLIYIELIYNLITHFAFYILCSIIRISIIWTLKCYMPI